MQQDFLFENRPNDAARTQVTVEGSLPEGLRGTFLFIGPGRTELNGKRLHLFDGYGRVVATTLTPRGVEVYGKHVRTKALTEDLRAGTLTSRRAFTNKSARWSNLMNLDFGNNCVHNVCAFAGHVIAAQDPGYLLLDACTLEVDGTLDFDGLQTRGVSATPMPRVDPSSGRLVAWFVKPGLRDTVTVAELDPDLSVAKRVSCPMPAGGLMHDIAFSNRYYLMMRFGELSLPKALWGSATLFGSLKFRPQTPVLYLVPRAGGEPVTVPLPARTHFHFFNAFEEDDTLVVDTVGYSGAVDFSSLSSEADRAQPRSAVNVTPTPEVVRYRINLNTYELDERLMPGAACEAPALNPTLRGRAYRYGYAPAGPAAGTVRDPGGYFWFSSLGKLDFETNTIERWHAPEGSVCSAAAFVDDPDRAAEDGGWVLSWVQDTDNRRSSLLVFDAQRITDGPIATCQHPDLFGLVSHVDFLAAR